jgi:hypothetical protein
MMSRLLISKLIFLPAKSLKNHEQLRRTRTNAGRAPPEIPAFRQSRKRLSGGAGAALV